MAHWKFEDMPDCTGRSAIVTGANTGIGYETARMLALKGADVTLACRSEARGQEAVERLRAENPSGTVELRLLDLADLEAVKSFAEAFRSEAANSHEAKLDLLILNAGVMVPPSSKTKQGFELQFGVNHLGHFALTGHLLPLLRQGDDARVVVVSSTAAQMGKMRFDDLQFERGYKPWPAYGQSKLANQLFTRELQRRLAAAGSTIKVTAAHPGWTQTDLQRTSRFARLFNPLFGMKPNQGALPTLRAATDPESGPGAYYGPHSLMQMRGYPVITKMVPAARRDEDARRLWELSEELTSVTYDLGAESA